MTDSTQFRISYDVVTAMIVDDYGYYRHHPLRNFGQRQGDAMMFRDVDCPNLSDVQIKELIKRYDSKVKYERINGRRFNKMH